MNKANKITLCQDDYTAHVYKKLHSLCDYCNCCQKVCSSHKVKEVTPKVSRTIAIFSSLVLSGSGALEPSRTLYGRNKHFTTGGLWWFNCGDVSLFAIKRDPRVAYVCVIRTIYASSKIIAIKYATRGFTMHCENYFLNSI